MSETEIRNKIVARAKSFIGTHEDPPGSNRGLLIDQWLRDAGTAVKQPWCAAFGYSVLKDCGVIVPVQLPAYVASWYEWGKENKMLIAAKDARPGDLLLIWFPGLRRHAHFAIIESVKQPSSGIVGFTFVTLEGNTDERGGRTGGQVMRKTRIPGTKDAIVRIPVVASLHYGAEDRGDWGVVYDFVWGKIPEAERIGHPVVAALNRLRML